ncbi:hypothetical protein [Acinetobacter sp. ANC 4862]|uniref:hypothetical protein n=1 Tax=Acinetobacter sp. ANC 4862 TaxID=2529849 RepID=UPI00103C0839|nr:hypothetical protein [Acinetobacter sp. ANC 4862]TCH64763.1 hypothetical protein E0409_04565 [Acinetobacter sp. ANC 4862]
MFEITDISLSQKIWCVSLILSCGWITSYYYQQIIKHPFDTDIAIGSILMGFGVYVFLFLIYGWHPQLAVLAGIIGGIGFSYRAT